MLITVPTYKRHSNGQAQTFENVPKEIGLTLVIREEERVPYLEMLDRLGRYKDQIWTIPTGAVNGIADTRNWILDKARSLDHHKVIMMDDDLHLIVRGKVPETEPGWDYKLRPCDLGDTQDLFEWMWVSLSLYAHCAVSMREGNNRVPGIGATVKATRGIRVVGYNLDTVDKHGVRFRSEVEGREDLDMTLQLLRAGEPNIVTYHWAQGQKTADAPGGLSETRTLDNIHTSAERLAELHPGLVKLRTKTNVSGALAGERTEVTIYWKKALKS